MFCYRMSSPVVIAVVCCSVCCHIMALLCYTLLTCCAILC